MLTNRSRKLPYILIGFVLCGLAPTVLSAEFAVATLTDLDGKAYAASTGGVTRRLQKNDDLFEQERIITSRKTTAELTFTDGTILTLGASTIVRVDSYTYRKPKQKQRANEAEEGFATSILQGAVRAVTGLLAKRRPFSVKFRTRVATIGIRGTHFAAEVDGDNTTVILLAQEDSEAPNAIEVANSHGKVEIDKPGWGTEVPDANSPPSPPRRMQSTESMNRIIRSVQTNRRVRIPRSPSPMR